MELVTPESNLYILSYFLCFSQYLFAIKCPINDLLVAETSSIILCYISAWYTFIFSFSLLREELF